MFRHRFPLKSKIAAGALAALILAIAWSSGGAAASGNPQQSAAPNGPPAVNTSQSSGRAVNVYLDDLPVAFPIQPFLMGSTTMVPLRALSEALGFTVTWDESGSVRCQKGDISIDLVLGSSTVRVNEAEVILPEPPCLSGDHTVIPLRFFSEAMGFEVNWEPDTYTAWVKSPKSPVPVWGFYALGTTGYSSWQDLFGDTYPYPLEPGPETPASHITGAILGWFAVSENGRITSEGHVSGFSRPDGWGSVMMLLRATKSKAYAMYYADNAGGNLSDILCSPAKRQRLATSIASSAAGFDGAVLDFEGLGFDPEDAEKDAANFTAFVDTLKTYLADIPLSVVLHPQNSVYKGYDHKALGSKADSVILMAYGYEEPGKPTPTAPWKMVDEAIRLEIQEVPADKIILGLPAYGTVYSENTEGARKVLTPAARDPVGPDGVERTYSPEFACEYSTWSDGETVFHAYTESDRSLAARVSLAKRHGLGGVAIWRLGLLQEGWLDVIRSVAEPLR
jgi:hypothetical protein